MSKIHKGAKVQIIGFDPRLNSYSAVTVSAAEGMRYLDLHRLVPEAMEIWSDQEIRELAAKCTRKAGRRKWERGLILLAHHRSRLACELLQQLEKRVPSKHREIYEMALGESHSWLGNSFERNAEGKTSLVPGNFVPGAASSGGKSN